MKIACVGGGPGGLYFALLMKKIDPSHEIDVYERNGPNDTFGWGVVFSEETLGALEQADAESYRDITSTFAHWNSIDVHYRGELIQCGGHVFCGIERKRLLAILQEHCREAGVRLHFNRELTHAGEVASHVDLVLAADGVNSFTRNHFKDAFQPNIVPGKSPYIWLGTHKVFDAFTFILLENEHGMFQVHAYAFDQETSTFIVECDEATLAATGLENAPVEKTVAYLESLFADYLDGNALLTNNSKWIRFQTVRNENWCHRNIVLLGDAAHTAHYSIGSGTKLAVEGAIALSEAFRETNDVQEALKSYESERRLTVAKTQRKAEQSQAWFEHAKRYREMPPLQLAFSLMTRSRKLTHETLKERDPAFVRRVDEWFVEGTDAEVRDPVPTPMFTPFKLRDLTLVNRVVVSPMCQYSAEDGTPGDWHLMHLGARAVGGAGLLFTEMTNVSREGRITKGCTGLYHDEHVPAWKRIVDFVHTHSQAKIGVQLGHAGRKGSTKLLWEGMDEPLGEGNWPLLAPSPIPYSPRNQTPKAMDRADMDQVREHYVAATERAIAAGFDLLEIHMAHGYLLATFLSPLTNQRDDEYGGSAQDRMRFPLEIFDAVRKAWPDEKPISVRLSAIDWADGGLEMEDTLVIARLLKEHGCDLIDVSSGQTDPASSPVYGRCYQTPFSDQIRCEVGIPTLTVGAITTHDEVNSILAAGRADLCALARPHLADPHWTLHAAADLGHEDITWPVQYLSAKPRPS